MEPWSSCWQIWQKSPHFDEDSDPHKIKPDPDWDPGPHDFKKSRIWSHVKVKTWIKIRMKVMWICNTAFQ
jgi:hypothetical protein